MTRLFSLFLLAFFVGSAVTGAQQESITAGEIETPGGDEFMTIVRPSEPDFSKSYPILFAPGNREYPEPMFFWGETPSELGWLIVQTRQMFRGSPAEMKGAMEAAIAHLESEGFKIADIHFIGWA